MSWRAMSLPGCEFDHMILLHFILELASWEGLEMQLPHLSSSGEDHGKKRSCVGIRLCDDLIKCIVSEFRERGSVPNVSVHEWIFRRQRYCSFPGRGRNPFGCTSSVAMALGCTTLAVKCSA
jgi:hypothetical protein